MAPSLVVLYSILILSSNAATPCMPNRECFSFQIELNPHPESCLYDNDYPNYNYCFFSTTNTTNTTTTTTTTTTSEPQYLSNSYQYICDTPSEDAQLVTYEGINCDPNNIISTETITNAGFECHNECTQYTKFKVDLYDDYDETCENSVGWMEIITSTGCDRVNIFQQLQAPTETDNITNNDMGNMDILFECTSDSIGITLYLDSDINDNKYCNNDGNYNGDYVKAEFVTGCQTSPLYAPFVQDMLYDTCLYKGNPSIDSFRHKIDMKYCGYEVDEDKTIVYMTKYKKGIWFGIIGILLWSCIVLYFCVSAVKNGSISKKWVKLKEEIELEKVDDGDKGGEVETRLMADDRQLQDDA